MSGPKHFFSISLFEKSLETELEMFMVYIFENFIFIFLSYK